MICLIPGPHGQKLKTAKSLRWSNHCIVANPLGGYVTIKGVWRQLNLRLDGGMNTNGVQLFFGGAGLGIRFGDFVSQFIYGSTRDATFGQNFVPGSEALAVDHNLITSPRFGQTITTDLSDRFALTIGSYGISDVEVPEPPEGWLIVTALVTGSTILRRWSVKRIANQNLMV